MTGNASCFIPIGVDFNFCTDYSQVYFVIVCIICVSQSGCMINNHDTFCIAVTCKVSRQRNVTRITKLTRTLHSSRSMVGLYFMVP